MDLSSKRGLIIGVANQSSIAFGCAQVLAEAGASLCVTYQNEKTLKYVQPLLERLDNPLSCQLDVCSPDDIAALVQQLEKEWGKLDFLIHSVAWSPLDELHGRVIDSSSEGFLKAMDVSCHSFIRMAKAVEPLMADGGTLITMSYYGSQKVIDHYNLMGPVKAALESSVRYMAAELGDKGIRVHTVSPGPMPTRAGSGIKDFDHLMDDAVEHSPLHTLANPTDVGNLVSFLVSDAAKHMTGHLLYVDAGEHIMY